MSYHVHVPKKNVMEAVSTWLFDVKPASGLCPEGVMLADKYLDEMRAIYTDEQIFKATRRIFENLF